MRRHRLSGLLLVLTVAMIPLMLGQSCAIPGLPSEGGGTFDATFYLDGVEVRSILLGSFPPSTVRAIAYDTDYLLQYNLTAQTVGWLYDYGSIIITYNDPDQVVPVEISQLDGSVSLTHMTGGSSVQESFSGADGRASGQINLTRSGGRLTGTFDFTLNRLRAVGTVDLPDNYGGF